MLSIRTAMIKIFVFMEELIKEVENYIFPFLPYQFKSVAGEDMIGQTRLLIFFQRKRLTAMMLCV
jgi:hypothetical protein